MEAKIAITFVLTFIVFISNAKTFSAATTTAQKNYNPYKNYLIKACNSTTYPKICYNSLSPYISKIKTNDFNLCKTALSVTLKAASNTSSLVKKLSRQSGLSKSEAAVIKDCVEEIGDSIYELKLSLKAMGSIKDSNSDMELQISNIRTWVSAAITDETTCTDGFEDAKVSASVKSKIKKSVLNVARLTSNALALMNNLSY